MNIAYYYMTGKGGALVEKLCGAFPGMVFDKSNYKQAVKDHWETCDAYVFVMASGIVVRTIAPYIKSKTTDPAVIVMDQEGQYVISLLSGHLGGANALAEALAKVTDGQAVITTATDVTHVPAMDVFAKDNHLKIENIHELKFISSDMVEGRSLKVYSLWPIEGSFPDYVTVKRYEMAELDQIKTELQEESGNKVLISVPSIYNKFAHDLSREDCKDHILYLTKQPYCVGTGCKRDMDAESYEAAFFDFIDNQQIDLSDIGALATIELKKDEICIGSLKEKYGLNLKIFSKETIDTVDFSDAAGKVIETSDFVKEITGVGSVSESCAWLGAGRGRIITGKTKYKGITFSLAEETEAFKV